MLESKRYLTSYVEENKSIASLPQNDFPPNVPLWTWLQLCTVQIKASQGKQAYGDLFKGWFVSCLFRIEFISLLLRFFTLSLWHFSSHASSVSAEAEESNDKTKRLWRACAGFECFPGRGRSAAAHASRLCTTAGRRAPTAELRPKEMQSRERSVILPFNIYTRVSRMPPLSVLVFLKGFYLQPRFPEWRRKMVSDAFVPNLQFTPKIIKWPQYNSLCFWFLSVYLRCISSSIM